MTGTNATAGDRLERQRRYRRLMLGFVGAGVGGGLLLRWGFGYPLVGEAVYWLGIVGFLAVWRLTPLELFDERDEALERRASQTTIGIFAVVLVVGASTARVLSYTDAYAVPSEAWAVLYGYAAIFAVFAVVYGWLRYR